jgi:hypothetical protein
MTDLKNHSCKHVAYVATKKEEMMVEMHLLPVHLGHKDVLMALSIISSSDTDERIVRAMVKLQDFVSKMYKNTLKQRPILSYFHKKLQSKCELL